MKNPEPKRQAAKDKNIKNPKPKKEANKQKKNMAEIQNLKDKKTNCLLNENVILKCSYIKQSNIKTGGVNSFESFKWTEEIRSN